jgi:hypothetical protein
VIRGGTTSKGVIVFAVIGGVFGGQPSGLAQDAGVDEPAAEVTDEGVPEEEVEATEAVSEVDKAMEEVKELTQPLSS